jgi:hypothetical protein
VRGQRFVRGPRGKPHLGAGGAAFSLSHTDGLALIGVARAGTIGVDLERTRPLRMSSRRRGDPGRGRRACGCSYGRSRERRGLLRAWCRLEGLCQGPEAGAVVCARRARPARCRRQAAPLQPNRRRARRLARQSGLEIAEVKLPPGLYGRWRRPAHPIPSPPAAFPQAHAIRRILSTRRSTPG